MINLPAIHDHVVAMLKAGLAETLTYHSVDHTLDVYTQCLAIAQAEGIKDADTLEKLQVAALYHDCGFLYVYQQHEEKGCEIAREQLPGFGIPERTIEEICGLIMATKVPQAPANYLQQIICDADLDYLGRGDFYETGDKLRRELIEYKFITDANDWEERQLDFLRSHHYFTKTSIRKRAPVKMEYIKQLIIHQNKEKR